MARQEIGPCYEQTFSTAERILHECFIQLRRDMFTEAKKKYRIR
jgi:hypothetical protein